MESNVLVPVFVLPFVAWLFRLLVFNLRVVAFQVPVCFDSPCYDQPATGYDTPQPLPPAGNAGRGIGLPVTLRGIGLPACLV